MMRFTPRVTPRTMIRVCLCVLCIAAVWCGWSISNNRRAAMQAACVGHLKQIMLALHNYHEQNGSFPPSFLADATGRPAHSWRILILPYLGEPNIRTYNSYNFSEPWDGPNNRALAASIPSTYVCPNHPDARATIATSYVAVTGAGTIFPSGKTTKFDEITRSKSETLMLVETSGGTTNWLQPDDLDITLTAEPGQRPSMSSFDPLGPAAAFADGMIRRVRTPLSNQDLRAYSQTSLWTDQDTPHTAPVEFLPPSGP